jgi:hypothetical protein
LDNLLKSGGTLTERNSHRTKAIDGEEEHSKFIACTAKNSHKDITVRITKSFVGFFIKLVGYEISLDQNIVQELPNGGLGVCGQVSYNYGIWRLLPALEELSEKGLSGNPQKRIGHSESRSFVGWRIPLFLPDFDDFSQKIRAS